MPLIAAPDPAPRGRNQMKPLRAIASLFACAGLLLANVSPAQQFVDSDGDGLYDNEEAYALIGTNPSLADTDSDGVED